MEKFKIKKGDKVIVIAGKDKGKTGEVLRVIREKKRLVVSNVNMVKKHKKPTYQSQGGIVVEPASIHISNIAIVDKDGKPTKVGYKFENGNKVRFAKSTGEIIG